MCLTGVRPNLYSQCSYSIGYFTYSMYGTGPIMGQVQLWRRTRNHTFWTVAVPVFDQPIAKHRFLIKPSRSMSKRSYKYGISNSIQSKEHCHVVSSKCHQQIPMSIWRPNMSHEHRCTVESNTVPILNFDRARLVVLLVVLCWKVTRYVRHHFLSGGGIIYWILRNDRGGIKFHLDRATMPFVRPRV